MGEAISFLTGRGERDARLAEVTLALAAEALALGGLAADVAAGRALAELRLADGSAAERFARSVAALGGPADLLDRPDQSLAAAPVIVPVHAGRAGYVAAIDGRALGVAVVELGGGRARPQDRIDHRVGLSEVAGIGERVDAGRPICLLHAADEASARRAAARIGGAVITQTAPTIGASSVTIARTGQPAPT